MHLSQFQRQIERIYLERDQARGVPKTFLWFVEEVGELARSIGRQGRKERMEEFADCLAWLFTLASLHRIDLEKAVRKYSRGCPRCRKIPCRCNKK